MSHMTSTKKERLCIYWARRDFRLEDNRALAAAIEESVSEHIPLIPLFILEHYMTKGDAHQLCGLPTRLFLSRAVPAFAERFPFFLCTHGVVERVFLSLREHYDISIFVNEDVHPYFYAHVRFLREAGIRVRVYADMCTIDMRTRTGTGNLYSVFTPFARAVWKQFLDAPCAPTAHPHHATPIPPALQKHLVETYALAKAPHVHTSHVEPLLSTARTFRVGTHTVDLDTLMQPPALDQWYTTEAGARTHFRAFLSKNALHSYTERRNALGDTHSTSHMSLALTWGLVSARTLLTTIREHTPIPHTPPHADTKSGAQTFVTELLWREFYKYLLFHHPHLYTTEFQEKYLGSIQWADDATAMQRFAAWIQGNTGYPLVDAAMREIAATGYMHNRARMVVASVLTKNLGVNWRWGQEYFRAALIDLDDPSNNGGWQWAASVGADPKPIRIFNPHLQADTYDHDETYRTRWLTKEYRASPPPEIVPHATARTEALARYGLHR